MQKLLILDRDGCLIQEPPTDYQVDSFQKLAFMPGVLRYLGRIARELDYELLMITNQDGLGTDVFPEATFWGPHNLMMKTFESEDIHFKEVFIDRTFAKDKAPTRKPGTALLAEYLNGDYDLESSFVVGDRLTDIQLAANMGAKGILIGRSVDTADDSLVDTAAIKHTLACEAPDWKTIYEFLRLPDRRVQFQRKTKETDIRIDLNLDGTGQTQISTGLGFFDHMLDQLGKHGMCDLSVQVDGDLHIDEHHTIEDTGLALGEAFLQALGDKKGIERYGWLLPMDEALAQVAIDFSGRPWLIWDAEFRREKVGDMPTEMFMHFFKSFSDTAKCTLNIKVEGDNEHHKIEAIFKGFAKAIKMAKTRDPEKMFLPSTKGML